MSNKRLYRSSTNYMLAGVCGGIAEYFDIDPTLVRLAWVILSCIGVEQELLLILLRQLLSQNKKKRYKRKISGNTPV